MSFISVRSDDSTLSTSSPEALFSSSALQTQPLSTLLVRSCPWRSDRREQDAYMAIPVHGFREAVRQAEDGFLHISRNKEERRAADFEVACQPAAIKGTQIRVDKCNHAAWCGHCQVCFAVVSDGDQSEGRRINEVGARLWSARFQ